MTTETTTPTMLDTDKLTVQELYAVLLPELEKLDDGFEYFSISHDIKYGPHGNGSGATSNQPIGRYRWMACYAVTGGSEGHYVHVDRIYQATEYAPAFTHQPIFLVKTFGGYDRACEIAKYLGARLGA